MDVSHSVDSDTPNTNASNMQSSGQGFAAGSFARSRQKIDPIWEHFALRKEGNDNVYTCLYCQQTYRGGDINRMKQHLLGITSQTNSCKKVDQDIRHRMQEALKQAQQEKQNEDINVAFKDQIGDQSEPQEVHPCPTKKPSFGQDKGKRKSVASIDTYFAPRSTHISQLSPKSALSTNEAQHKAKMAIARWMYDACIPFSAIQSPYFRPALDAIAATGPRFKGPSYYELRFNLLRDCKRECQLLVDSYRANWAKTGCTIMVDGWSDQRQQTLINFFVYCPTGITFVKSIDASHAMKDAVTLYQMFFEVIEWVGPTNVVHVVTDNAANYVAAGKLIHENYEHIYWSPCAFHCLNLLLKDIGSLPHVVDVASKASKVTVFVYNHMVFLSWLRNRESWKEIVRPGVTQFATTFVTLKSIYDHKHDLQGLVIDKHFTSHRLARTKKGKAVAAIILDNKFWNDCFVILKVVAPIFRFLRIVDSDEKPSLGYVYEGMQRAKNAIKAMFKNKSHLYKPYKDIIKARWNKHLKRDLHAAAYFLNPCFFYDDKFSEKNRLMPALLNLLKIKSNCTNLTKAFQEIQMYCERKESFGRESAYKVTKTVRPDEWWRFFGGSAPILQRLAIRLLSQTSSSLGCEHNWSFFERIHTKKRNRLEHQRLNDLIYVSYNLRLKNRLQYKMRSYDPIDYESVDKFDFWIAEEEPTPEFDDEDKNLIDKVIYQETAVPITSESSWDIEGDEEIEITDESILVSQDDFEAGVGGCIGGDDIDDSLVDDILAYDGFDLDECYD